MLRSRRTSAALTGTLFLIILSSCSLFTKDVTHEVYVPVRKQCLFDAPPAKRAVSAESIIKGGTKDCPATYDACVTAEASNTIFQVVKELNEYASDAWTLCGPTPPKPTVPSP